MPQTNKTSFACFAALREVTNVNKESHARRKARKGKLDSKLNSPPNEVCDTSYLEQQALDSMRVDDHFARRPG